MKKIENTHFLFGLNCFSRGKVELLRQLTTHLLDRGPDKHSLLTIFTPNPEQVVQAHHDPHFASVLGSADILLPDGIGLVLATRLGAWLGKGRALSERISGTDVVTALLKDDRIRRDAEVLVIGGRNLSDYVSRLRARGWRLTWSEAYQDAQQPTIDEERAVRQLFKQLRPKMVFVALGAPAQEKWVNSHLKLLAESEVRLAMVVGGAFDMLSGQISRAPSIVQKLNLEWLYRLVTQPWRWRRQLRLLEFIPITVTELFK